MVCEEERKEGRKKGREVKKNEALINVFVC
jgi:hypothetical protein